ncbi:MAG: hypothetical protein ABJC33_06630 [Betaproteobacteria bacterium]
MRRRKARHGKQLAKLGVTSLDVADGVKAQEILGRYDIASSTRRGINAMLKLRRNSSTGVARPLLIVMACDGHGSLIDKAAAPPYASSLRRFEFSLRARDKYR